LEQEPDNPAPEESAGETVAVSAAATGGESTEQPHLNEQVSTRLDSPELPWLDDAGIEIIRATRSWIQYGTLGFAVICIIIGAVEGLLGR
jgi:hypothetical protein